RAWSKFRFSTKIHNSPDCNWLRLVRGRAYAMAHLALRMHPSQPSVGYRRSIVWEQGPGLVQRRRFAMSDDYNVESKSGASWHLPAIIVLGLIAIGGLAFGWNASSKLDATQQAVTSQVNSFKQGV